MDPDAKAFGRHGRSCRRIREYLQETLAQVSDVSPDTIRRLEHGGLTLRKLCGGLQLTLTTLFEAYEIHGRRISREVVDLIEHMSGTEQRLLLRLIPLLRELDQDVFADDSHEHDCANA